jgi:hypothetical protein
MTRSLAELKLLQRAACRLLAAHHVALHESAHFIVAGQQGLGPYLIEIGDDETGRVLWEHHDDWQKEARSLLAGGLAEFLFTNRALVQLGDVTDREKIDRLLTQNAAGPNAMARLISETSEIVKAEWPAIEAIAAELVRKRSLNKEQIAAVIAAAEEKPN